MYTAVTDDQIIVIINGKSKSISRGSAISAKLLEELSKPHPDESVVAKLIDVKSAFTEYTGSDMEIMHDGTVMRNGDALPAVLAQKVVECFRNGVDYQYLLNFFDNLNANPSRRAVEELYGFLAHGGMPITPDGASWPTRGSTTSSGRFLPEARTRSSRARLTIADTSSTVSERKSKSSATMSTTTRALLAPMGFMSGRSLTPWTSRAERSSL